MTGAFITSFEVLSSGEEFTLHTEVYHHSEGEYELFSITQDCTESGGTVTVLLHREQLAQLANIAKGH